MPNLRRIAARAVLVVLPLAAGVVLVAWAATQRAPLGQSAPDETVTAVRVVTLEGGTFVPRVTTYGSVEPATTWRGVARVAAEVAWLHPELESGHLIEAGAEIVRLDATDYELAEARAAAEVAGADARLDELDLSADNLEESLAIERRALELAETELERRQTLRERNAASQTAVDQAEESVLQSRQRVQELDNELRLIPSRRRVQEAQKAAAEAQLSEARRAIGHAVVSMPFEGRIAEVAVERDQYVPAGEVMVVAEAIDEAEVSARLRLDQLETLIGEQPAVQTVAELSATQLDAVPLSLGLDAELRLSLGERTLSWPAQLRGASFALDPRTRTIGIVVAVSEPLRKAIPGVRPPLVKDMFVEIVLSGAAREDALVVPREALRRDEAGEWIVHVANDNDRLESRRVAVDGTFGNLALVADGLAPGERLIVGELAYAVEGMRVSPQEDQATKARIAEARRDGPR